MTALLVVLTAGSAYCSSQDQPCEIHTSVGQSLQRVIDSAPEGSVICLGAGTWTQNLSIKKSVTIKGQGSANTTIRAYDEQGPVIKVSLDELVPVRVVLEDLEVLGRDRDDQPTVGISVDGISTFGAVSLEASACLVSRGTVGIELRNGAHAQVTDSVVNGSEGNGIHLGWYSQAILTDTAITSSGGCGLLVEYSAQVTVRWCSLEENAADGLHISTSGPNSVVDTVIARNGLGSPSGEGCGIALAGDVTITGTTIVENNGAGLAMLVGSTAYISNSSVVRNGSHGMYMMDSTYARIAQTEFNSNAGNGVELWATAAAELLGNEVVGNERFGISLHESPCSTTVHHYFEGLVSGHGNVVAPMTGEQPNKRGAVCPEELSFLMTNEGGQLDRH